MSPKLRFIAKSIFSVIYALAFYAVLLFVPAGTLHWPRGLWFMGVVLVVDIVAMLVVFRGHEDLLDERLKPPIQKGQPLADKILTAALLASFMAATIFVPLDVFRFHLLLGAPSLPVAAVGCGFCLLGWFLASLALRANAFAAPVVKHQAERQQTVVDSGVYGVVRHPMYAGGFLMLIGTPLWLGSYAATLAGLAPALLLLARIPIEERFLRRELPGYEAYTQRVRYRLLPNVW